MVGMGKSRLEDRPQLGCFTTLPPEEERLIALHLGAEVVLGRP